MALYEGDTTVDLTQAQQCFADSHRLRTLSPAAFEYYVRMSAPSTVHKFVRVGAVDGEKSGSVEVFVVRDGDPNTVISVYLDDAGKVTAIF